MTLFSLMFSKQIIQRLFFDGSVDVSFFLFDKFATRNPRFTKEVIFFLLEFNCKFPVFEKTDLSKMAWFEEILGVLPLLFNPSENIANKSNVLGFLRLFFGSLNSDEFARFLDDAPLLLRTLITELWVCKEVTEYATGIIELLQFLKSCGEQHALKTASKNKMVDILTACEQGLEGFDEERGVFRVKEKRSAELAKI